MMSVRVTTIWVWTLLLFAARAVQGGSIADSLKNKYSKTATTHDAIVDFPSIMDTVLNHPQMQILDESDKTSKMISLLHQFSSAVQAPFLQAMSSLGITAKPLWISNDIFLKDVPLPVLQLLAKIPGRFLIREPVTAFLSPVSEPIPVPPGWKEESRASEAQWGVNIIGAPVVWKSKTKGSGIIVANIDTGVKLSHEALKDNYAGKWYDPVYGIKFPFDIQGHGTHTMGIMCGKTYGIGVAPEATWIACQSFSLQGSASEENLKQCGQWILEQKPHVVSNSWGGGQGNAFYNDVVTAWKTAGIFPVFAIGNSGRNCSTANSPGDQPDVWGVGSTRENDTISDYSSRGPTINTKVIKPDVSAPGEQIYSSYFISSSSYKIMSGTSMASPHAAGAVALMKAAEPTLTNDQIIERLQNTAAKPFISSNDACGSDSLYPNNAFGNGRINVKDALGL